MAHPSPLDATPSNFGHLPLSRSQRIGAVLVAIATFLLVGHAVSHLVSGCLGQTPSDQSWNYVIALLVSLGIGGACAALQTRSPVWNQRLLLVSGAATGAVTGFYYVGLVAGKNPQIAAIGAIAGALLVAGLTWRWRSSIWVMVLRLSGAIAAYGWFLLVGANALACFNTAHWLLGSVLGSLSLLYLWFTARSLKLTFSLF